MRPRALLFTSLLLGGLGCEPIREFQPTPFVQAGVEDPPRWRIDINRLQGGVFRTYAPACIDSVRAGQVVEWRNFLPEVPANVSTIAGPEPLWSPNLVRPYHYVSADDPTNDACEESAPDGTCAKRAAYSFWRTRFDTPGVYDWIDTNQGSPGRRVVDPYYGTVTFVGLDPSTKIGTVCVPGQDGTGCEGICCSTDKDCKTGASCFKTPVDATGRCRTPSG